MEYLDLFTRLNKHCLVTYLTHRERIKNVFIIIEMFRDHREREREKNGYYSSLVRIREFSGSRSHRCNIDVLLNNICLPKAFFVFFQSLFNILRVCFDYLYAVYAELLFVRKYYIVNRLDGLSIFFFFSRAVF